MPSTLRDEKAYRNPVGKAATMARAAIRKLTIELTSGALWNLLGLVAGDEEQSVPVFSGIGWYARPPDGANSEAVVAKMGGGSQNPAIIASRDEDTRKAVTEANDLAEDETIAFNSKCVLYLKADGTIEAKTTGGVAVALALKSDVDTLGTHVDTHKHAGLLGGTGSALALTTSPQDPLGMVDNSPAVVGTAKLKAE